MGSIQEDTWHMNLVERHIHLNCIQLLVKEIWNKQDRDLSSLM